MPTRRRGGGRGRSSRGEGDYKMGDAIKNVAKKGIEGYLKGTQKLADKIDAAIPKGVKDTMKKYTQTRIRGRRGRGRNGTGGTRTGGGRQGY